MPKNNAALRSFTADRAAGLTTVPAEALCFDSSPFELAAAAEDGKVPVKMRARSAQPIVHWYWGKVVHDMAGFKAAKKTLTIDYCHYNDEVLGYLDQFSATDAGLDVAGFYTPFTPDDRASEIIHKSGKGVPYESSIFFDPNSLSLEEVGPNVEVQVNGYKLQGPALIVRKWSLRGVATCPYGADGKTSTKFSADELGEVPVHFLSPAQEPAAMSQTPAPNSPAQTDTPTQLAAGEKPAEKPAPVPADPRAEFKATLAKFTEKFGATNGAAWAAEGLSYEEALDKHAAALATQLTAEQGKSAELATKLAAAPRGENEPVSFNTTEKHPAGKPGSETPAKFAHLGALGKFAAGINLPGKK